MAPVSDKVKNSSETSGNNHAPVAVVEFEEVEPGLFTLPHVLTMGKSLHLSSEYKNFARRMRARGDIISYIRELCRSDEE